MEVHSGWLLALGVTAQACLLGSGASSRRAAELELAVHGGLVADPREPGFACVPMRAIEVGCGRQSRQSGGMPFVRAKGGATCALSPSLLLALIGSLVAKGGGPAWESFSGQRRLLTFSMLASTLCLCGWRPTALTSQA